MKRVALLLALVLVGCLGSLPASGSSTACSRLRAGYKSWGAVSVAAAASAGGGGMAAALPETEATRLALGAGSVVVAVVSAVATYMRDADRAEFDATCTGSVR